MWSRPSTRPGATDIVVNDVLGTDDKWRNLAKRQVADVVAPADLFALARRPQARRRHPHGRDLRHHRDRRRPGDGEQLPHLDAAAGLVHRGAGAVHLRLVGRDLRRRRRGLRRRLVAGRAAEAQADESLRLEQAIVRPGGGRALREEREAAAAMGGPEVLQRVRPERVPQGRDDEPRRQALRRRQGRPHGAAVQVASRRASATASSGATSSMSTMRSRWCAG